MTGQRKKTPSGQKKSEVDRCSAEAGQESRQWYRLIVNNVRDFAIFSADISGKISSWNPGAERFFGYTAEEILGKPMEILYTPEDRAAGVAAKERSTSLETGTSEDERWHIRKDGSRFFVFGRVNPMFTDEDAHCGYIKIARDITPRKELEQRLRSSEELHRLILENIQDFAILTLDMTGKIETWNTGAKNTFGYEADEAIGQNVRMLYVPEQRGSGDQEKTLAEAMNETMAVAEHWCVRKDGRHIFVSGVIRPVRDDTGSIRSFCMVARDITGRRNLQDKLERTQAHLEELVAERTAGLTEAVHELETFSYSLSHDMRAPLRAMQGFAHIISERYGSNLPDEGRDLLNRIAAAAYRLDSMIRESLAYHRAPREPLPVQRVELDPLLETLRHEHPAAGPSALTVERPLLPVLGHGPSLMQALLNLVDNALRFVPSDRKPKVRVFTRSRDGQVRICVQDNGIGIAAQDQDKVWNLFARLYPERFEGTGIGLALVRRVTERMGGKVGLESEEGKGSTFWLQLPAA